MHYVYILASLKNPSKYYIGRTTNLDTRLKQHNYGISGYTSHDAPWRIETYLAFSNEKLAESFEKYLKHGSGHAFLKKRLLSKLVATQSG